MDRTRDRPQLKQMLGRPPGPATVNLKSGILPPSMNPLHTLGSEGLLEVESRRNARKVRT